MKNLVKVVKIMAKKQNMFFHARLFSFTAGHGMIKGGENMIRHRIRQCLAGVLSFAMAVTMLPSGYVKAEETDAVGSTQEIAASKFVASGGQIDDANWLIATTTNGTDGTASAAAYVAGETASEAAGGLGKTRVGAIAFELREAAESYDPEGNKIAPDAIYKAVVSVEVAGVNENMGDRWTKAALFPVDAGVYGSLTSDSSVNENTSYPAVNDDYSYNAAIYSNEQIAGTNLGTKTFDVTEQVKAALEEGDPYAIFRVQTVICGILLKKDSAKLSITTLTDEEAVEQTANELKLPKTTAGKLSLPKTGVCSTQITWASDNTAVIANDGTVTRPTDKDAAVTMTATITKGGVTQTREFTVTVKVYKEEEGLLAEYEFADEDVDDKLIEDVSGNENNAALKGSGASIANGILTLPGGDAGSTAAYVELPGTVFENQDTLTINTWLKNQTGADNYAAMYFGTTTSHIGGGTAGMPVNYWILNPAQPSGYFKSVVTDGSNSSAPYNTETAVSTTKTSSDWGMYTTVITADSITGYYNGVKVSEDTKTMTTSDFGTGLVAFIGRSAYNDMFYKGGVYGVKVYSKALSQQEIWNAYYGNVPYGVEVEDLYAAAAEGLEKVMLKDNSSADAVTKDLSFPEEAYGISLKWTSSDTGVINDEGKNLYEGEGETELTISVEGTINGEKVLTKTYNITVMNMITADYNALEIPDADNIRGNITLPLTGANGSVITWESSDPAVITDTKTENADYDDTPAGVVTRGTADKAVTLTATITNDGKTKEKVFSVTVKAEKDPGEMTDYVFAYFIGNGAGQEAIFLATSRDGKNWEELNSGEALLTSEMGTTGLRDPYIFRSAEGDKFYLIATDLCIAKDGNWTTAQQAGSQAIMVWESEDLVNWSEQRMVTVSDKIGAGCTWAPEVFYDDKTGEYLVFWASKVAGNNYDKQRLYYAKTRDFYTFTEPQVWIDETWSTIDSTVVKAADGTYYRFTKNESETFVYMEKADSLLGDWTMVNTNIAGGVEGPCCFKLNDDDKGESENDIWYLLLDNFGAGGYYPMVTEDISAGEFTRVTDAKLPSRPRHGTVMNITAEEYMTLMNAYGTATLSEGSIPDYVTTGYELPDTVEVTFCGEKQTVEVTWEKETLDEIGTVTVNGTIPSLNHCPVKKTVEVVSEDLIYFIDSGVGSFNTDMPESSMYNTVSALVPLRNDVPDQEYTEGSWGIKGVGTAVKNRTSTTDSIYTNGWWATDGSDCEYILPLESGSYVATGYFGEWWSQSRPMEFYAEYTNDAGDTVKSEVKAVTISGSASNVSTRLAFTVEGVEDTTEVHFLAVKAESSDPVIAGLSVEEVLDADGKLAKALKNVTVTPESKKLYLDETAQLTVNYPDGFEKKLAAADTELDTVTYTSKDSDIASVDTNGLVTAKIAGKTEITTTITLKDGKSAECRSVIQCYVKDEEKISAVKESLKSASLKAEAQKVYVGKEIKVNVEYPEGFETLVEEAGMEITSVVFDSKDKSILTVSEDGVVTGAAEGTAEITAVITLSDGTAQEVKTEITAEVDRTSQIKAVKRALDRTTVTPAEMSLYVADTVEITVSYPSNFNNLLAAAKLEIASVKYESDAPAVAAVSEDGIITAAAEGTAVITTTITLSDETEKKLTSNITVQKKASENPGGGDNNPNPAPNPGGSGTDGGTNQTPAEELTVTLDVKKASLGIKEKLTLKPVITGNTAGLTVSWSSSNKKVAAVSAKGVVTAKKKGSATITGTIGSKSVTCKITVKPAPKKITLNAKSKSIKAGKTFKIKVKLPKNTASYKITYKSSNKKVAAVSDKGVVSAKKKGKATITVKTFNGKKATLKITVKK